MKKLLLTILLTFFLSGEKNFSEAKFVSEILIEEKLEKCVKNDKWVCDQNEINEILRWSDQFKFQIKNCSETNYKAPCRCDLEANSMKKKYCEIKVMPAKVKKSKMQAADYCSKLSNNQNLQVREEYFKICMKEEGY